MHKVLILGVNGFIGSHLAAQCLALGYETIGVDIFDYRLTDSLKRDISFNALDIRSFDSKLKALINTADIVIPLVAIATPKTYVTDPIKVFELDFEANIPVIRECLRRDKFLIFPSTSEVYGLTKNEVFEEATTELAYGPIHKERWIYACSKQLLDRVIFAYGAHHGLRYAIFRPFNWIGPGLDRISEEEGTSRLLTELLCSIFYRKSVTLVNGGDQRRTFCDIRDGISALSAMISRSEQIQGQIFNIGNPNNEHSVREFYDRLAQNIRNIPSFSTVMDGVTMEIKSGFEFYGAGYQDVDRRVPNIQKASSLLDWFPRFTLDDSLSMILNSVTFDPDMKTWGWTVSDQR